jgi:hypothetical protein
MEGGDRTGGKRSRPVPGQRGKEESGVLIPHGNLWSKPCGRDGDIRDSHCLTGYQRQLVKRKYHSCTASEGCLRLWQAC